MWLLYRWVTVEVYKIMLESLLPVKVFLSSGFLSSCYLLTQQNLEKKTMIIIILQSLSFLIEYSFT